MQSHEDSSCSSVSDEGRPHGMAGADDAEIAFRELVDGERAAMRSDVMAALIQANAILCRLFPG